ncbi:UNVERIFIED_CONTAM: putative ATP-dependent endonuclease of OLD family [Paenibacillus sp. PvR008]
MRDKKYCIKVEIIVYLNSLKIWNWRKFGESANGEPCIDIIFNPYLNVIVGENDSGKTSIIDSIKLGLSTNSQDQNWIKESDFFDINRPIKIEYIFQDLTEEEEAYFFEWIYFEEDRTYLRIYLEAEQIFDVNMKNRIVKNVTGGEVGREQLLSDSVKQLLTVTYLKPLRDAELELSPGNRSRFAQILKNLSFFQENEGASRKDIEKILKDAFKDVQTIIDQPVLGKMSTVVEAFFEKNRKKNPKIEPKHMKFEEALRKLELNLGEIGSGLGSSNLLFMAAELLLLSDNKIGPKLALIEEIEAHVHPQSQLRLIKYFEKKSKEEGIQYILTSHSPILISSVSLEHLILIYNNAAFPMRSGFTLLEKDDYNFFERFLDATKSNMFFAQGIICVEGDAENLLIPALAEAIGRPLYDYGVSIVNVGNLAFKRYTSIFLRKEGTKLNFPVSIVTDMDLKPISYYRNELCYFELNEDDENAIQSIIPEINGKSIKDLYIKFSDLTDVISGHIGRKITSDEKLEIHDLIKVKNKQQYGKFLINREKRIKENFRHETEMTRVFLSSPWTLEYALAESSLSTLLQESILEAHYKTPKNRVLKKKEWDEIDSTELRSVEIYQFVLENQISKSVISQLLASKIIDNKNELFTLISNDNKIRYLIDAIKHVTGDSL